ncbi:exocyst complex component 3-like protein 2 [Alosa pseudoharengus]|uniref:tumor necrosis factor alpha-induced protein 2 n=1 Tax=Alosa sapidissima TaxID=34773 RepID=UPI001C0A2670|nr:tumor necrosis factor alpha-induced protein 2 [Alosa sapidissima]
MPFLKKLPGRSKGCHNKGELTMPSCNLNPFEEVDQQCQYFPEEALALERSQQHCSFDSEAEENGTNQRGSRSSQPLRGTLVKLYSSSPLKTLGKLGKELRNTARSKWGSNAPSQRSSTLPSEKRRNSRRSSEEIMTLLRYSLASLRKESTCRESLYGGDYNLETDDDARRRPSFLRIVSLGKLRRESMVDRISQEAEEETVEEPPEVKPKEPLSVLEILRLVNQRSLLLADTHIQELERECELDHHPPNMAPSTSRRSSAMSTGNPPETMPTSCVWDAGRRKAKDVELLYEALLQEMWDVVRESLRQPCAGPQLGLVVLVIQQEEAADSARAQREKTRSLPSNNDEGIHEGLLMYPTPSDSPQPSCRPRSLMKRWEEAVGEAADWSLPQPGGISAGQLASFLERLSGRVLEDLDAACRNVVAIYPEDFRAFQVYVHSYHRAVAQRLKTVTSGPLQITDTYALLDWIYNIYSRDVLGPVSNMATLDCTQLEPLLPPKCIDRLEQDCINTVKDNVSIELSQVLEDEERRWAQSMHIEEYQSNLARSVIQRLKVDIDRSTAINEQLGARVARCTLSGLADFLQSFKRKVELFHETQADFGDKGDGYISKTIALVNCIPPFRNFVERCRQCDSLGSTDSLEHAHSSLETIVNQSTKVLTDKLFDNIRPFFDKLVKRKWLNNTEAYENIEITIKQHFKKFRRMDCPPYQVLVNEVHRRVLIEYVRAIMRGRIICTSLKMRKRVAYRLQDEAKQIKALFKDLESDCSWLDSVIAHLADIILLEDIPSIQMEVGVLVKEFPDIRRRHISTVLNMRGMMQQTQRQVILGIVCDLENSESPMHVPRDHALFSEIPVTSEVSCLGLVVIRMALTVSSWVSTMWPHHRHRYRHRRGHT